MTENSKTHLEDRFHRDMVGIYETAKRELHYNASYFIQMVAEHGGLKTAQKLLWTADVSSGFTVLWEHQRLDLSVEALVLQEKYDPLFTDGDRKIARDRLEQYGYKFQS
jgi:hypothetical protein